MARTIAWWPRLCLLRELSLTRASACVLRTLWPLLLFLLFFCVLSSHGSLSACVYGSGGTRASLFCGNLLALAFYSAISECLRSFASVRGKRREKGGSRNTSTSEPAYSRPIHMTAGRCGGNPATYTEATPAAAERGFHTGASAHVCAVLGHRRECGAAGPTNPPASPGRDMKGPDGRHLLRRHG